MAKWTVRPVASTAYASTDPPRPNLLLLCCAFAPTSWILTSIPYPHSNSSRPSWFGIMRAGVLPKPKRLGGNIIGGHMRSIWGPLFTEVTKKARNNYTYCHQVVTNISHHHQILPLWQVCKDISWSYTIRYAIWERLELLRPTCESTRVITSSNINLHT